MSKVSLVADFNEKNVSAIALLDALAKDFRFYLHPQALMESIFVPVGTNDIEKKKSTDKFTKRLRVMSPDMDLLHNARSALMGIKNDFKTTYKLISNEIGFNTLAKQYATLDFYLKDYVKIVKQQKKNPELLESLEDFSYLLEINVFEMMKKDFETIQPTLVARQEYSKKTWPDFVPRTENKSEPQWEKVNECYKEQLKKLKEKK